MLYGVFLYMGVASLNGIQVRFSPPHPAPGYSDPSQLSMSAAIFPKPQVLAFPLQWRNNGDKDTTMYFVPSQLTTAGPS